MQILTLDSPFISFPLPYQTDGSITLGEFINKIYLKVNELIEATNNFYATDVTNLVNAKLNEWKTDGTITELLGESLTSLATSISDINNTLSDMQISYTNFIESINNTINQFMDEIDLSNLDGGVF